MVLNEMSKSNQNNVRKLGNTHILFYDKKRWRQVQPIMTLQCKQGTHGNKDEYHVGPHIVSKATFDAVIECLETSTLRFNNGSTIEVSNPDNKVRGVSNNEY